MKKIIVVCLLLVLMGYASQVFGADIKVMQTFDVLVFGENCLLLTQPKAFKGALHAAAEEIKTETKITLKSMIKDGWKIVSVQPIRADEGKIEYIIFFTK
jgi:hypothetical protein